MKEVIVYIGNILNPSTKFILEQEGNEPIEVSVERVKFYADRGFNPSAEIPKLHLAPKEYVFKAYDRQIIVDDLVNCKLFVAETYLTNKLPIDLSTLNFRNDRFVKEFKESLSKYLLNRYIVENGAIEHFCVPLVTDVYFDVNCKNAQNLDFVLEGKYKNSYCTIEEAEALEDVYYIDEKGNRVKKYTNNLSVAKPTSEQQALLNELSTLITKIRENGIEFCYDSDWGKMVAVNMQSGLISIGEDNPNEDEYAEFAPCRLPILDFEFPYTYLGCDTALYVKQK